MPVQVDLSLTSQGWLGSLKNVLAEKKNFFNVDTIQLGQLLIVGDDCISTGSIEKEALAVEPKKKSDQTLKT